MSQYKPVFGIREKFTESTEKPKEEEPLEEEPQEEEPKDEDNKNKSLQWWVWLIIALGVILLLVIIYLFVIKKFKKPSSNAESVDMP
jgi:hypothetical protein